MILLVLSFVALFMPAPSPTSNYIDYSNALAVQYASSSDSVPFYSQFKDITSAKWKKVGCGIASLAMVIDYYQTDAVSVDHLLSQGIALGAYTSRSGWTHQGLITLSEKYGLEGTATDLSHLSADDAYARLSKTLSEGPVIASVHYKLDPKNPIPHLIVVDRIEGDMVVYNDPAAKTAERTISSTDFVRAWKKRMIVMRPAQTAGHVALI